MRVVEGELVEDDLDALLAVAAELVVAVDARGVRLRVVGRGERAVLGRVAVERLVAARRACAIAISVPIVIDRFIFHFDRRRSRAKLRSTR